MAIYSNINTASRTRQRISSHRRNSIIDEENTYFNNELERKNNLKNARSNASNPNSSIETLRYLSHYLDEIVRRNVVKNPSCTIELLYELSDSIFSDIKEEIIKRKDCPYDILLKLAMDKDPNVRKFAQSQEVILNAAKNDDKFPFEVLIEMAKSNMDIYKKVMLIAKDPNIKEEHLKLIIKSNSSISMVAMMNPNCPVDILINQSNSKNKTMKDFAIKVLKIRASNPATSIDDLIYLSKIKEYQLFVANNPSCPDFILISLKNKPVSLFFSKSTKKRIKELNNNIEQEEYSLRRK